MQYEHFQLLLTIRGGTSLAVQWLRLLASNAGGAGLIPGQRTKIPLATWPKKIRRIWHQWARKRGAIALLFTAVPTQPASFCIFVPWADDRAPHGEPRASTFILIFLLNLFLPVPEPANLTAWNTQGSTESGRQRNPAHCLFVQLRMVFTFLNGWGKKEKKEDYFLNHENYMKFTFQSP